MGEQLFDRKLKLMEQLKCSELLAELERADAEVTTWMAEVNRREATVAACKAGLADEETTAALNADLSGKTEAARTAQRKAAVSFDPAVRISRAVVANAEDELGRAGVKLDAAKRDRHRLLKTVEYRTACLAYLGGG